MREDQPSKCPFRGTAPGAEQARARVFRSVAYVMHGSTMLPWRTVLDNIRVEESLRVRSADISTFERLSDQFGLQSSIRDRVAGDLSLGMRQRVEIAKAIAFRPDLLLLDEALSGIDAQSKRAVYQAVSEVAAGGVAVVGTAHQILDLLRLADRVYTMNDGRIRSEMRLELASNVRLAMAGTELLALQDARGILFDKLM